MPAKTKRKHPATLQPQPLPKTNNLINPIPEGLIKTPHISLGTQHLQINLRAPPRGERPFSMLHQPRTDPEPPFPRANRERIHPSPMPVIPSHHGADNTTILDGNEKQLRLSSKLIGNGQMRITLRP